MSVYLINKVCHWVHHNKEFRERLREDPQGTLTDWGLDADEISAFVAGDVAELYRLGAHPFLLMHLNRQGLFGLDREKHFERIKVVVKEPAPNKRPNPAHASVLPRDAVAS